MRLRSTSKEGRKGIFLGIVSDFSKVTFENMNFLRWKTLNEIDAGDCSGLTMEEIKARSENANLKESCCIIGYHSSQVSQGASK